MHMANELLSPPVAVAACTIAAGGLGLICHRAKQIITSDRLPLMGILGAFIFAAQMVNIRLPLMPGTSGHMIGAVLVAIILGPAAGAIVISSVVIIQCLIFQDGGLLALGCNIINMAIVPSYLGYFLYKTITSGSYTSRKVYIGAVLACVIAVEAGAVLVPIQTALSGVLVVPFATFLITMSGVHLLVGLVEGVITVAVLAYLKQLRPDILADTLGGTVRLSKKAVLITFALFTVAIGGGLCLLASEMPDGLEWSYAERPNQPDFEPFISNENPAIAAVDDLQSKYSPMPDYSVRSATQADVSRGWTSFAGITGSLLTMLTVWIIARVLQKKPLPQTG